ncbi:MAG TPA: hypothetical protein VFT87_02565 [Candidatus Saccharimonadales bacterium]|nr:hypothetical protein [Candidatus Saccharimonadales bacterium]
MANLKKYAEKILSEQDKTLFQEAVVSASKGAPRGAYILIWIACAESLKRKFKEAALRDGQANRVVGQIQTAEDNHQSADMLILNQAKSYGFIDDAAFQKLEHIYDLRCLYGHPYEAAPSDVELIAAAEVAVNEVLSKPALLKQGFVQRQIEKLFDDPNYLEHSEESVREFARDISDRIDSSVYSYLLEKYSERIEAAYNDASLSVVVSRGLWFLSEFISKAGTGFYTATQWHDYVSRFPNTGQRILLSREAIFDNVGARTQDYVISYLLSECTRKPTFLKKLEKLQVANRLSQSQQTRFNAIDISTMQSANLSIACCYQPVIDALKSHNWYKQNPAAQLVKSNLASIGRLQESQQDELGRNILQAAEGGSGHAAELLVNVASDFAALPDAFIKGIILEVFLNEANEFRLKVEHIERVIPLMRAKPGVVAELSEKLPEATPKSWTSSAQMAALLSALEGISELAAFRQVVEDNRGRLITSPFEDSSEDT